jgi:hypothetical protein
LSPKDIRVNISKIQESDLMGTTDLAGTTALIKENAAARDGKVLRPDRDVRFNAGKSRTRLTLKPSSVPAIGTAG